MKIKESTNAWKMESFTVPVIQIKYFDDEIDKIKKTGNV